MIEAARRRVMKVENVPEEWMALADTVLVPGKPLSKNDLRAALAAVIPAIQAEALERAAVVAETHQTEVQRNIDDNIAEVRVIQITPSDNWPLVKARDWLKHTAATIRALKEGI
jgi:hypothetical protein